MNLERARRVDEGVTIGGISMALLSAKDFRHGEYGQVVIWYFRAQNEVHPKSMPCECKCALDPKLSG